MIKASVCGGGWGGSFRVRVKDVGLSVWGLGIWGGGVSLGRLGVEGVRVQAVRVLDFMP